MENIIIKINGQFVSKSSKNAGSAGSSETTMLTFVFDDSWNGYAKRVIWRDAKGENETSIILVPDVAESTSCYTSTVPAEVMKVSGWCSFCIEGYYDLNSSKVMKSASDYLFVSYSYVTEEKSELTPDEAMQLQAEFEDLMPKVSSLMNNSTNKINELCENLSVWENYNEQKLYHQGNKVAFNGRCYVCINDIYNVSPENDKYWLLISERGEQGTRGAQGIQGIQGEKGDKGDKGEKGDKGDKGEKGDKGDKGEKGINASVVPLNGFYSFSVDENGDLWVNYPDSAKAPEISLNENGELILSIEGERGSSFNAGKVKGEKGDAFTYADFTDEQKEEMLKKALPDIERVNAAADKALLAEENAANSESNAKMYCENAQESEKNASVSEKTASQALSDLLAMINSGDLVLATDGKLPLSSIPATATQEIYTVSSENELTGLTAQRGDLAELIEEINGEQTITKTWQCLGDASVRENWVVWGTSYAVQSGNATTADNATNANMINNHRLVEMSEEEFAAAVKDENTYYLIY